MDRFKYKSNRMIEDYNDIQEAFKDSVLKTNIVVDRWIKEHNIKPERIFDEEIRSLLIGYLKKFVFIDRNVDFRRLNKNLIISTFKETRYISNVTLSSVGLYWNDGKFIEKFGLALQYTDYLSLTDISSFEDKTEELIIDEDIKLNLETIEQIKF